MNRGTRRRLAAGDDVIRYGVAGAGGHLRQRKAPKMSSLGVASDLFAADENLNLTYGVLIVAFFWKAGQREVTTLESGRSMDQRAQ